MKSRKRILAAFFAIVMMVAVSFQLYAAPAGESRMAEAGDAWVPAFGVHVQLTRYYQALPVLEQVHYNVYVDFPLEDLTGVNSEYVIVVEENTGGIDLFCISIVPRENRGDANIEDKKIMFRLDSSEGALIKDLNIPSLGIFNLLSTYHGSIAMVSESNAYRSSYYLTGNPPCDMQNDMIFDFYASLGPAEEDECPGGGSHNFSAIGLPAVVLPEALCPGCGRVGYCAQQYTQCTKCDAMSEYVRCGYCGWQG